MEQQPNNIPAFLKKYYDGTGPEGQAHIETIAQRYEVKRQDFMQNVYPKQAIFQDQWNKLNRRKDRLDPEKLTWHLREEHRAEAEKVAKEDGYVEKQPQQTADGRKVKRKQQQRPSAAAPPPANSQADLQQKQTSTARQAGQQENPRQAFLTALQQQRQRQGQRQEQAVSTPQQSPAGNNTAPPPTAQTDRERFLAQLQTMRSQGQKMTHRQA